MPLHANPNLNPNPGPNPSPNPNLNPNPSPSPNPEPRTNPDQVSRAGLTLLYAGHTYFEDLALPGWAPQPDWQLAFGAAAAELTDNHWIDDLKVRALALRHLLPMSTHLLPYSNSLFIAPYSLAATQHT